MMPTFSPLPFCSPVFSPACSYSGGWRTSYRSGDAFGSGAMAGLLVMSMVLLLLAVWGVVRGIVLVARVLRQHPHHHGLRVLACCCLGSWILVALAAAAAVFGTGTSPTGAGSNAGTTLLVTLAVVAGVITGVLFIVAKVVDLEGQELFQREPTKELLLQDVLQRPWWGTGTSAGTQKKEEAA